MDHRDRPIAALALECLDLGEKVRRMLIAIDKVTTDPLASVGLRDALTNIANIRTRLEEVDRQTKPIA